MKDSNSANRSRFQFSLRSEAAVFVAILVAAFVLRAALVWLQWNSPVMNFGFFGADSTGYDAIAQSLVSGGGFAIDGEPTAFRTPVYPMFLAAVYSLFGRNFIVLGVIQSILGAAVCYFTYKTAILIFGRASAVAAAVFVALSPDLIIWTSGYVLTEPVYIFLLSAAVYAAVKLIEAESIELSDKKNIGLAALTGLLFSLTALTRPAFLYFAIIAFVFLALKIDRRKLILMIAVFLIPVSIWTVRNYAVFDEVILTTTGGGYVLYEYHNPITTSENGGYDPIDHHPPPPEGATASEADDFYKAKAVEFILENPGREMRLTINRFWNVWRPALAESSPRNAVITSLSYIPVILFALPAILIFGFRDPKTKFLVILLAFFFVFHVLVAGEMRFRYPLMPVFSIFAAAAAVELIKKIRSNS
ncbi:MAG: glycosyltransferase family 39 protein [Pyrinomonadaceae bacterium]|nr:glycosyltransferase family 39 protein [Pyrinomonadaceae bacterium]